MIGASPPPSLPRRFFRLTGLNILANLTVPLASLADVAMLGRLPEVRYLAGVSLGAVIFDVAFWAFGFLRMSTTGLTAQALGRGDTAEVYRVLYRGLAFAGAMGTVLLLVQLPLRELGFALLSGTAGVEQAGRVYFDARVWSAPAALANFAFLGWFLGREESGRALVMTLVANVANIVLNWVFILHLGMAAFGAGLATTLSQLLMLATAGGLLLVRRQRVAWHWREILERSRLRQLVDLNRDILLRTLCLMASFAVFLNVSSILGVAILAANTLLYRLFYVAVYFIDGAAFATESLAGILRGGGRPQELRRLLRLAHLSGQVFGGLCLTGLLLAPRGVLSLLTTQPEILTIGARFAPWLVPVLVFGAVAFIYDGLFLGLTAGRALRNSMLLSTLGVFVPLAAVALHSGSNHLLWLSLAAFMAARGLTLGLASGALLAPAAGREEEAGP